MSYCTNCGRQILDESLGCPVCNVRNNIDPTKLVVEGQAEEIKAEPKEEANAEPKAETVDSFTVEDAGGKKHHFETNEETGDAEYKKKTTVAEDATIPTVIKVLVIVLIVIVGGFGAIAGCVAGVVLSKSPSEDYRKFGKLMLTVSIVMLVLSFVCCVLGTAAGVFTEVVSSV
nr:hypothetical protein [uncultured Anaerotignum sp.]